jgi:4-hydroxy-tetrahydrodipicolinate reductase
MTVRGRIKEDPVVYRVVQWGTGVVARESVAGVLGHPELELVGARTYNPDKEGADVGELAGLHPLGVTATRDDAALLAGPADCVLFMVGRTWVGDPAATFEELLGVLRAGKNVVSLWWPALVFPARMAGDVQARLEAACREGGSTFCTVGMDPGYGTAGLALAALPLVREVKKVHMYQIMNNAHWEGEGITLFYGFGQPDTSRSPMLAPGVTTRYHETTLHLIGEAIGVEIEEIVEQHTIIRADEAFEIRSGSIPAGGVSGIRYQVLGLVGGEPRVVVEHVERLREQDYPELEFSGDGYRAEIEGLPGVRLDMKLSAPADYAGDCIAVASAMSVVNAIPQVCRAAPGVLSMLDLRPFPSRNVTTRDLATVPGYR